MSSSSQERFWQGKIAALTRWVPADPNEKAEHAAKLGEARKSLAIAKATRLRAEADAVLASANLIGGSR